VQTAEYLHTQRYIVQGKSDQISMKIVAIYTYGLYVVLVVCNCYVGEAFPVAARGHLPSNNSSTVVAVLRLAVNFCSIALSFCDNTAQVA